MDSNMIYQRTEIILGSENVATLKSKHILICGIGGVGSFALEALVRIGIGKITIIDKDTIDITNINRQIIANMQNVGESKVDVAENRCNIINKNIIIYKHFENINVDNVDKYITKDIDYVLDCVDSVGAKVAIISKCSELNINCISCMGMGNKVNPLDIDVSDIYKTSVCPLAKIMRKRLKEININKQKVVYSKELPQRNKINNENILGSVSFVPSVAGLVIASEVVKDILNI